MRGVLLLPIRGLGPIERNGATAISLLLTRRFAPLFHCQFFAAFSDNFLLNALALLILFELGGPEDVALIPLATGVLIAPSFFLSALGGELADRFDMATVARRLRIAAICVAALAAFGFIVQSLTILFVALLIFGVVAALFGPIRYGILPHILVSSELPVGNALVEGSTIIAVLLGTILAGLVVAYGNSGWLAALVMAFPLASWGASLFIPRTGESAPGLVIRWNIFTSTLDIMIHLRDDRRIAWGAWATCWFWAAGVVVFAVLPPLVKNVLGGTEIAVTVCLAIFSIGIAAGSGLAAWLAAGRITLLPTVVGAALIGVFAIDLGWATWGLAAPAEGRSVGAIFTSVQGIHIGIALAGLAMSGGLFIVPVLAAVQSWAGADRRARVIAAINVLTAALMAGAALLTAVLQAFGVTPPVLFIVLGIAGFFVAIVIGRTMPATA